MNNFLFSFILAGSFLFSQCTQQPSSEMPERNRQQINFNWKFFPADSVNVELSDIQETDWQDVNLPHDWAIGEPVSATNPSGARMGYFPGGIGWYRKILHLGEEYRGKKVFIEFDGIYMNSDVWINGHHLGHFSSGYVSHYYDLTPYLTFDTENILAVRVDNSHQPSDRWYAGCGIYRHVWLTTAEKVYIPVWGTYITTQQKENNASMVTHQVSLKNESGENFSGNLITNILYKGETVKSIKTDISDLEPGLTEVLTQEIEIKDPKLWSIESPELYTAHTSIISSDQKAMDNYSTIFGIRDIHIDTTGLYLNGERIILKGVNIHHDAGCLGAAVPDMAVERRLRILKEMGCNTIRLSHYPHAPELLDMCDRMGILTMSEFADQWEMKFSNYGGKEDPFVDTWEQNLKNFIKRDRNHPSVFMWSLGNETMEQRYNPKRGVELLTMMRDFVHAYEPSRKVTCAMVRSGGGNRPWEDPSSMIHYTDITSYNYRTHRFKEWKEMFPEMMFISTETQMYNNEWPPSPDTLDFSKNSWFELQGKDYILGQYIWAGIDYLGESKGWPDRACPVGLLNTCGFRKPTSYFTESIYSDKPMVYLAVHDDQLADSLSQLKHSHIQWYEPAIKSHWNYSHAKEAQRKVYAFTNCESVKLLLNGKAIEEKNRADFPDQVIRWEVDFEPGEIVAVGLNNGNEVCRHALQTAAKPEKIVLLPDHETLKANGQDVCHVEVRLTDMNGIVIPDAKNLIRFSIEGAGKIIGVDNGDVADHFNFKGNEVQLRNGKCLVVVQSDLVKGYVKLTASADGMEPASVVIQTE